MITDGNTDQNEIPSRSMQSDQGLEERPDGCDLASASASTDAVPQVALDPDGHYDSDRNNASPVSVLDHPPSIDGKVTKKTKSDSEPSLTPDRSSPSTYHTILARASHSAFGLDVKYDGSAPFDSPSVSKASFRSRTGTNLAAVEATQSSLNDQTRVLLGEAEGEVEVTLAGNHDCQDRDCDDGEKPSPTDEALFQPQPQLLPPTPSPSRSSCGVSKAGIRRTSSLLDSDCTPSPAPRANLFKERPPSPSPAPTPPSFSICCGVGSVGCHTPDEAASSYEQDPRHGVEQTIAAFLSDPVGADGGWFNGWQAWSHFGINSSPSEATHDRKDDIKRILRNRVGNMNARHRRVQQLEKDFDPFDTTPGRRVNDLQRSSSFSASKQPRSGMRRFGTKSSEASLWKTITCTEPSNDSPFVLRTRGLASHDDDDDLCYDSDPEESTRRRSRSSSRRCSLHTSEEDAHILNRGGSFESRCSPAKKREGGRYAPSTVFDDDIVRMQVQNLMNETFTLVWHPPSDANFSRTKPQAMKVWIERGQQLNRKLVHPKFVWKPLHSAKATKRFSVEHPNAVTLLDISRIIEVNQVDRKKYPFAKRSRGLLLECLDQTMLFEASSESERGRIAHGLKLIVARLGSKIIVEDSSVFDEFFSLVPAVPGTSPVKLLTGK